MKLYVIVFSYVAIVMYAMFNFNSSCDHSMSKEPAPYVEPKKVLTIEEYRQRGIDRARDAMNEPLLPDYDERQIKIINHINSTHERTMRRYIDEGILPKEILDMSETEQLKLMRQKLCIERRDDKHKYTTDDLVDDVIDEIGK